MKLHILIHRSNVPFKVLNEKPYSSSFSQNIKNAGINLTAANMSCPQYTAVDHKGFFNVEVENPAT